MATLGISLAVTMHVTPNAFLLTFIITAIGMSDSLQRNSFYLLKNGGLYHPGPVFKSFTDTKRQRCVEHCMKDLACVSFNFNRTSDQCILLGEIWEDGELKSDPHMDFFGEFSTLK